MVEISEMNLESVNIDVPKRISQKETTAAAVAAPEAAAAAPTGPNIEMSNLVPPTASLDQVSAKEYLQLKSLR